MRPNHAQHMHSADLPDSDVIGVVFSFFHISFHLISLAIKTHKNSNKRTVSQRRQRSTGQLAYLHLYLSQIEQHN